MTTTAAALDLDLDRVEADRLIVALDRHVDLDSLADARRIAANAHKGHLILTDAPLARHCLRCEGNAPELLMRLSGDHTIPVL